MTGEFWLGLAAFPAAGVAYLLIGWLIVLSRRGWRKLHVRLVSTAVLRKHPLGDSNEPAARRLYDALVAGNRLRMIEGLGYVFIWGRENGPERTDDAAKVPTV